MMVTPGRFERNCEIDVHGSVTFIDLGIGSTGLKLKMESITSLSVHSRIVKIHFAYINTFITV